ncbi:MAG: ATP-binding cassette domain-containing protein [Candidatus Thiosymbion ectosymbiont of Robbea hypermnestra]|nr:ATP-binding cassette domain-containing protein [Candidatus Thiosymbion ectosymbiont of Robbea hypermnestra]
MIRCELEGLTGGWRADRPILRGITLVLPEDRSRVPLMGPSGRGKSTLLYHLAALKWPFGGQVRWEMGGECFQWGEAGRGLSPAAAVGLRREYFGFAFQNATLSSHLSLRENLAYPLLLRGAHKRKAQAHAEEGLHRVLDPEEREIIGELLDRMPSQLSAGQKQRIALAQAMMHDPKVLFADEPTGNLDIHTRREIIDLVLEDWVGEGEDRKLIWITHHEEEPMEMGVDYRLFVDSDVCHWQRYLGSGPDGGQWERE